MLMQHGGMTEDEVYKTLPSLAMGQHKKLVEIATAMSAVVDVFQSPPCPISCECCWTCTTLYGKNSGSDLSRSKC